MNEWYQLGITIAGGLGAGCILTQAGMILDHNLREKPYESKLTRIMDKLNHERIIYKNKIFDSADLKQEIKKFHEGSRCKALLRRYVIPAGDLPRSPTKSRTFSDSPEFLWDFLQNNLPSVGKESFNLFGKYTATLRDLKKEDWLQIYIPTNHFALRYELGITKLKENKK